MARCHHAAQTTPRQTTACGNSSRWRHIRLSHFVRPSKPQRWRPVSQSRWLRTVFQKFDGTSEPGYMSAWRTIWAEAAVADDLRLVVEELERVCGLPSVHKLPRSTAEVLTFRLTSAFLTANAFSSGRWECRMGYTEISGPLGGGVRREFFEPFPELQKRLSVQESEDFIDEPAYRFWFLLRDNEPRLGLEASTGSVETLDETRYDLMDLYRSSNRSVWPLVWKVAGNLFPESH